MDFSNFTLSNILLGSVFSSIGLGYFMYGKKMENQLFLFHGVALMVYPYFGFDTTTVIVLGILLCISPFVIKRL